MALYSFYVLHISTLDIRSDYQKGLIHLCLFRPANETRMELWIEHPEMKGKMSDHAGPRRSDCPPCTKWWRLPAFVTQFWRPRSGFGARFRFCFKNKNFIHQKEKRKNVGNGSSYCCVHTFPPPMNLICYGLTKTETGAKTAPRSPKPILGCQNLVTKAGGSHNLAPGTLATRRGPAWSVI